MNTAITIITMCIIAACVCGTLSMLLIAVSALLEFIFYIKDKKNRKK